MSKNTYTNAVHLGTYYIFSHERKLANDQQLRKVLLVLRSLIVSSGTFKTFY